MIEIVNANSAQFNEYDLKELYNIVVKGYELTESEIWGENYIRVFFKDYRDLIDSGEIRLALFNGKIAGGIHGYAVNETTYAFSLLATDFNLKGKGIGTALIRALEIEAKNLGATSMTIEILRVKHKEIEGKITLARFYERLGYAYTHSEDCICKIPQEKYKKLKAPSNFDFYVKAI